MEGEPELAAPPAGAEFFKPKPSRAIGINPDVINVSRSFNTTSTCTSTTSSSSSSPPDLVAHIQAAFKRQRPIGMMQSISIKPRRCLVAQRETSRETNTRTHAVVKNGKNVVQLGQKPKGSVPESKLGSVSTDNQEHACITPPSESGSSVSAQGENFNPYTPQGVPPGLSAMPGSNDAVAQSHLECGNALAEVQRKVHFSTENLATSRGADDRMVTGSDDLISQMDSLALTETEWDEGDQVHTSAVGNQDWQHYNCQSMEIENNLRYEGRNSSLLARKTLGVQDQLHQLGTFLQKDLGAMTQSSVVGSSCATSTLINSTSAPRISSTIYIAKPQSLGTRVGASPTGKVEEVEVQLNVVQPSYSSSKYADGVLTVKSTVTSQAISSSTAMPLEVHKSSDPCKELHLEVHKSSDPSKELQCNSHQEHDIPNYSHQGDNHLAEGNATDAKSLPPSSNRISGSDVKVENLKADKVEAGDTNKAASRTRKRGYDPELFFKVNGKLYQRLGKIGSGGSSEVHKVISSDCKIYALKKIKLKGRDYATAFGFCQEIEYLNRLKGKNNIIQLIDYEVTDKTLLREVMNGSMSNKDSRVKEDGYIYMVLEYGEIDLAHMLSHKWKELDGSTSTIDNNWLRYYWQQILLAVNTIHEERIVHSDLKPANFLLVRGSLKLIDFGIAKAILSDTTNIQRDSQVGTLSYMSPEAFMCNEMDANGNMIKCGRPSDIWSLGCILYQMVYGRTPFSEYKTFWAKFKVITCPNHEIVYEPVSNPWLLDLMRKCLAWDRNERWRIPELLKHPFLVPPVPAELPNLSPRGQSCKLLHQIKEASMNDQKALDLYSQLQSMLMESISVVQPDLATTSKDQLCELLRKISTICYQLQERLASS